MANRASETMVKNIIDTELSEEQVTPFLNAASHSVTAVLVDGGAAYGSALLRDIEAWLAAHLVCMRDPQITEEKTGDGRWKFAGKFGEGLDASTYGQQIKVLDHKGFYAQLQKAKGRITIEALPE